MIKARQREFLILADDKRFVRLYHEPCAKIVKETTNTPRRT